MELQKLKEECNFLIEEIESINKRIKIKEEKIRTLEESKTIKKKAGEGKKNRKTEESGYQIKSRRDFYIYYPAFMGIMSIISDNREFYEYRNYSKQDKKYKKVKKSILDSYIREKTDYEKREFYELASDYMLIRNDEGRYIYKNDSTEVIYVNRKVLENSGCF